MKGRRRFAIRPLSQPNAEINVTPLVDVVLVLLIIFMVVTPLLEKDIAVRVPPTEKIDTPDDLPPDQLVVKLGADGVLRINDEAVSEEGYVARLGGILENRRDKTVFVVVDDGARYAGLVHLLDGAKQAGAITLGMATDASHE
jgi:biopolymer transport protein ExbD